MSYGNGIKLTAGFDVGAKTPLDSKSVVQTIAERDAFVTDNLVYEGLEVYVKDTGHKYRYNGTSWIDLDAQSDSESGTGEGLTTEQANQLTTAYKHSQTPHVQYSDIPTKISDLENDSNFITSIPEEYITETELEAKGYLTSHQDISNLQPKTDNNLATTSKEVVGAINEVKSSVDGITVPTKTSDLTNDSGFITSIPSEYITETELETKGYLTEHQSLTDYAKKTDIPDVSDFLTEVPAGYVTDTKLSTELDKKVNKEVGKGLSTNDLTNELVTKINSSATEAFVTNAIANAQLGSGEVDLSGYATIDALKLKADLTHTHDQYLTKVPDEYITETELNDKNYADKTYVTQAVSNVKVDLTGYAKTSDIPKKISQLTNDKGYLSSVPSEYVTETELTAKGYLTEHQDISNLALKSEIPDVSSFITSDDLPTVPTKVSDLANDKNYISSIPSEYVTETELNAKKYLTSVPSTYALKTDIPTVPTKTSDLTNDSNFITSIPAEYITETELNAKGYLTSHQDISGLQTKTDKNLTTTSKEVVGAINELKTNISNINTGGGSSFSGSYNDLTDKPTIPTKTSDLNNDSGFIGYPDVIVINKGSMDAEVDLDNDIPLGRNTILLTGRVVYNTYGSELVFVYRDRESSDSFTIYTMKGDKVVVNKSNGDWKITSNTSFIYSDSAKALYQRITDNTLTTTAKTIPTAINELKSGLNGIKVPTKTSELTNNSGFITTIPDEYITETELNAKGYLTSHQDISGLQTKTDNNLATTSKEVVGAINEVKSLNDTKLNKTDANKLNCVTIDNVSLKEYILTNFTGTEKTYYLIAKTTCTDLPKASNFFITVETPGLYTYKVTAKELNDSNGRYVCTYRTISSSWTAWEKVLITGDITTTISDSSTDTQVPSAKAVNDKFDTLSNRIQPSAVMFKKENTSYSTLRELIQNHEFFKSSTAEEFIFGAEGFDDLPVTDWGFSIRLYTRAGNKYIIAYMMLSNDLFYTRSMDYDGIWLSDWKRVCTTSVADVPETTVDLTDTDIHGSIKYMVKSGICYVSAWGVLSDTVKTAHILVKADVMPKPIISCGTVLVDGDAEQNGKLVGHLYIDNNKALSLHIYPDSVGHTGFGSFSYPVAES